mmetsp:Transcript_96548/g.295344  ORF Transcript_96548/g.295344 Transcript_96548/m.295344 type:complete len:288 (-) Transcript_96548:500-1363(-)
MASRAAAIPCVGGGRGGTISSDRTRILSTRFGQRRSCLAGSGCARTCTSSPWTTTLPQSSCLRSYCPRAATMSPCRAPTRPQRGATRSSSLLGRTSSRASAAYSAQPGAPPDASAGSWTCTTGARSPPWSWRPSREARAWCPWASGTARSPRSPSGTSPSTWAPARSSPCPRAPGTPASRRSRSRGRTRAWCLASLREAQRACARPSTPPRARRSSWPTRKPRSSTASGRSCQASSTNCRTIGTSCSSASSGPLGPRRWFCSTSPPAAGRSIRKSWASSPTSRTGRT